MADAHAHVHAQKRSTAPITIGVKAQQHGGGVVGKMSTRGGGGGGGVSGGAQSSKTDGAGTSRSLSAMAAPSTPAKEMTLNATGGNNNNADAGQGTRQGGSAGKERQPSTGSWTPGSSSSLCYLSESMRSSDQYAIYDMNHFRYGGASYGGTPSPLIVSSVGQGFSWSRDVFLSRYGQEHYGDGGYGTPEERIEAHEIILDDEPMFEDL